MKSNVLGWVAAAVLLAAAVPARAQGTAIAPATHTTVKHLPHHVAPHRLVAGKPVPVVKPRHAGPPRRAVVVVARSAAVKTVVRGRIVRKEPPKAVVAPVVVARKPAPPVVPADVGSVTGLHLPRYASLKSDDVNMRVGPAERYPVAWTYKRRELPVKIEGEFDVWRKVEDMDGIVGWMHQATLTGRRTFVVTGTEDRTMRAEPEESADAVAVLKPGVVGRVRSCEAGKDWCQVQVQDYRGWLKRGDFWGVDAGEVVAPG